MAEVKQMSAKEAAVRIFDLTSEAHGNLALFSHFGERLVEWARVKPGDRVLDVGAGTGASVVPAAERVGAAGQVTGVDLAPRMVDQLQARIIQYGIENATALVADAESLEFGDDQFDVVLCGFVLFFLPNTPRALSEYRRVLVPGGTLALSTFTRRGSSSMDWLWGTIGRHVPVPRPAQETQRFDTAHSLEHALTRTGFTNFEMEEAPYDVILPDFEAWWEWLRSMEFREYIEAMDETTLEQFRTAAWQELRRRPEAPGVAFPMDALLARASRPR